MTRFNQEFSQLIYNQCYSASYEMFTKNHRYITIDNDLLENVCIYGHIDVARDLIIIFNIDPSFNNNKALRLALFNCHINLFVLLLNDNCINIDSCTCDNMISHAIIKGRPDIIKMIYNHHKLNTLIGYNWAMKKALANKKK